MGQERPKHVEPVLTIKAARPRQTKPLYILPGRRTLACSRFPVYRHNSANEPGIRCHQLSCSFLSSSSSPNWPVDLELPVSRKNHRLSILPRVHSFSSSGSCYLVLVCKGRDVMPELSSAPADISHTFDTYMHLISHHRIHIHGSSPCRTTTNKLRAKKVGRRFASNHRSLTRH